MKISKDTYMIYLITFIQIELAELTSKLYSLLCSGYLKKTTTIPYI